MHKTKSYQLYHQITCSENIPRIIKDFYSNSMQQTTIVTQLITTKNKTKRVHPYFRATTTATTKYKYIHRHELINK